MRLVCPSCEAVYQVPDTALVASARVRCARCGHEWSPAAPPDSLPAIRAPYEAPDPPRPPAPSGPAMIDDSDLAPGPQRREKLAVTPVPVPAAPPAPGRTAPMLAWAASLVLLIGIGWAGIAWREPVMHAWPASSRLYATLGLWPQASVAASPAPM